jgi:hypothetical protein
MFYYIHTDNNKNIKWWSNTGRFKDDYHSNGVYGVMGRFNYKLFVDGWYQIYSKQAPYASKILLF